MEATLSEDIQEDVLRKFFRKQVSRRGQGHVDSGQGEVAGDSGGVTAEIWIME